MINRSDYAKWLAVEIDVQERYHNHKETMAWVVTALYVPGIIYIGLSGGQILQGTNWVWVIFGFIVIVGYLVLLFANMQFRKRWEAADTIHILMRCWADLNREGKLPEADEWRIEEEHDKHWPHFVQAGKCELWKKRKSWKNLAASLLFCRKGEKYDRWKTELPSYIVIFIATVLAMILVVYN